MDTAHPHPASHFPIQGGHVIPLIAKPRNQQECTKDAVSCETQVSFGSFHTHILCTESYYTFCVIFYYLFSLDQTTQFFIFALR